MVVYHLFRYFEVVSPLRNGLNIMSYFKHIVPHSFLCKVSIETPAVFTHRELANLLKIPTGILLCVLIV